MNTLLSLIQGAEIDEYTARSSIMANPQAENGHADISNEILEALARILISPDEWRILMTIFRKTYGWHKKADWISLSQFAESTGMAKPHICRSLSKLVKRNMIIRTDNDKGVSYGFQKDYEKWQKPLPKQATLPKQAMSVAQTGNRSLPKQAPTKETITKETITKENDGSKKKKFIPPTIKEVIEYAGSIGYQIDAEYFIDKYNATGWKLSNGKTMKNWKATVVTWKKKDRDNGPKPVERDKDGMTPREKQRLLMEK